MRADGVNWHVDPVITEMNVTQQIPILHVCDLDKHKSKGIIMYKNLLQVCSTDESESENISVKKISMEERKQKIDHKIINANKEKYATDETEDEKPLVKDNTVINEPSCFNLFECGKKLLNKLDATCEQGCMATSKD